MKYSVGDYVYYTPFPQTTYPAIIDGIEDGKYRIRIYFKEQRKLKVARNIVSEKYLSPRT